LVDFLHVSREQLRVEQPRPDADLKRRFSRLVGSIGASVRIRFDDLDLRAEMRRRKPTRMRFVQRPRPIND
jgi:hypothetical protein